MLTCCMQQLQLQWRRGSSVARHTCTAASCDLENFNSLVRVDTLACSCTVEYAIPCDGTDAQAGHLLTVVCLRCSAAKLPNPSVH
jgi:hypothetical protein